MSISITEYGAQAVLVHAKDSATARSLSLHLRSSLRDEAVSVVPGADTVTINCLSPSTAARLLNLVEQAMESVDAVAEPSPATITLPVRYNGEDLDAVADILHISREEVVARHSGATYRVEFLGFAPGFPYLSGLDPLLAEVPRLSTPRTRVAEGSVGIAAGKTCVYPGASPGGWRLLGVTDTVLFNPSNDVAPALLSPGDTVLFTPAT